MPIGLLNDMQHLRQLGEIRIGHRIPLEGTDRNGKPKSRPAKLDKFRLTSPSKPLLEEVARLYGGEVRRWTPGNGDPDEWEVFTNVDRLPVLVRGYANDEGRSVSTEWFEHWEGRRLKRRCDGELERISKGGCLCDPNKTAGWWGQRLCKPTTRLNVMLRDVRAIGNWLIISHGRNAAETLPPMARFLARSDGYIPASLGIEEQVTYPEGKPPNRFMVPILEVELEPMQLISGNGAAAIGGGRAAVAGGRKAIEAAADPGVEAFKAMADDARTLQELTDFLLKAQGFGHAQQGDELFLHFVGRRKALEDAEVAVAELVEDDEEKDKLWALAQENAPEGWDLSRLKQAFASRYDGLVPTSGSTEQLRDFLAWVKGGAR